MLHSSLATTFCALSLLWGHVSPSPVAEAGTIETTKRNYWTPPTFYIQTCISALNGSGRVNATDPAGESPYEGLYLYPFAFFGRTSDAVLTPELDEAAVAYLENDHVLFDLGSEVGTPAASDPYGLVIVDEIVGM